MRPYLKIMRSTLFIFIFSLSVAIYSTDRVVAQESTLSILKETAPDGFSRAIEKRKFSFPEDHGPHPGFKTEWWYFTGNLKTKDGREFGYQWTIFRNALSAKSIRSTSAWVTNQTYMGHLGLTDVRAQKFYSSEKFSRGALGLASATAKPVHVHLDQWSIQGWGPTQLKAKSKEVQLELALSPGKGPVLQGDEGLSQKSGDKGNASYYYSFPRMPTVGKITIQGETFEVSGQSWLDREWSTSSLAKGQVGWDWFAIQLSDGREIMLYQLREKNDVISSQSEATLIEHSGKTKRFSLAKGEITLKVLGKWTSEKTKVTYPSAWEITIPSEKITLRVTSKIPDQEHRFQFRYWEGAVSIDGNIADQKITGEGYVELTGY